MSSFSATILSDADVDSIINSAKTRVTNDVKYSSYLLNQLIDAAANANLKERFSKAIYEKRSTSLMLCELHMRQTYNEKSFLLEEIIVEYDTLEKLASACGRHVEAYYETRENDIQIYLQFVVRPAVLPTADEALQQRRLEKETSW